MRGPSGPFGDPGQVGPWGEETDDRFYAHNLAIEHARAVLVCRLEDRLLALKRASADGVLTETKRQISEAAAEGRMNDVSELILQIDDILQTYGYGA